MKDTLAHPPITSRDEWLAARKALLVKESELTKQRDAVNALRRHRWPRHWSAPSGSQQRPTNRPIAFEG